VIGLILSRCESVLPYNQMDKQITSVINKDHFHQKTPVNFCIRISQGTVTDVITALTHLNATAEMAVLLRNIIVTVVWTVEN